MAEAVCLIGHTHHDINTPISTLGLHSVENCGKRGLCLCRSQAKSVPRPSHREAFKCIVDDSGGGGDVPVVICHDAADRGVEPLQAVYVFGEADDLLQGRQQCGSLGGGSRRGRAS